VKVEKKEEDGRAVGLSAVGRRRRREEVGSSAKSKVLVRTSKIAGAAVAEALEEVD